MTKKILPIASFSIFRNLLLTVANPKFMLLYQTRSWRSWIKHIVFEPKIRKSILVEHAGLQTIFHFAKFVSFPTEIPRNAPRTCVRCRLNSHLYSRLHSVFNYIYIYVQSQISAFEIISTLVYVRIVHLLYKYSYFFRS